jgi:hypothetical protein
MSELRKGTGPSRESGTTGAARQEALPPTPGPWHAYDDTVYSGQRGQHAVASCDVGTTNWGRRRANARLIAAAPDLYEALRDLVQLEGARFGTGVIRPGTYGAAVMGAAREALAKAEGRQ